MDLGGQRLILHALERGEARAAQRTGLASFDQSFSLIGSVAEPAPAVGFDNAVVRSSHSLYAMTALLRSCQRFQIGLWTTLTALRTAVQMGLPLQLLSLLKA
jgi:hypothetical protein